MAAKPKTRTYGFYVPLRVGETLNSLGVVLIVLWAIGLGGVTAPVAFAPFVVSFLWTQLFRWHFGRRAKARAAAYPGLRRVESDLDAVGWSVAMGLLPGYGHRNEGMSLDQRRTMLAVHWTEIMDRVEKSHGFLVSAVLSDARVLYPTALGCPEGGEHVVVLSGSSNPTKVEPEQFDAYIRAVEHAVQLLREIMGQNSVRIEFHRIARSTYYRADGRY